MIYSMLPRIYRNAEAEGAGGGEEENQGSPEGGSAAPEGTNEGISEGFAIPEAYQEKGWTKNLKSEDDVWKMLDNAQALAGKKMVVPDWENADPKEIDEYISNLRPKDKGEYKFPEDVAEDRRGAYADMLHDIGIPAYQANKLIEKYTEMEQATVAKMYDETEFMGELKKSFGDEYEKIGGATAKLIAATVGKEDRELLEHVPNEYLGLVYRITAGLAKQYGASENGAGGNPPSNMGSVDVAAQRTELRTAIAELDKKPHTAEERQVLVDKLNATYQGR